MLGVIALCVAFGLLALLLSLSRWLAHRPWAAAGNLAVAVLLLLVAHRLWPPVLHLQTYESMQPKALIAQVHCERTGPSAYRVTLTRLPAGHMQVFEMSGDEWRLDVRTLVWTGQDASLLDFAERHGIEVESGCRSGGCGSCETRMLDGSVKYEHTPDHDVAAGHCLLCVGRPATSLVLEA